MFQRDDVGASHYLTKNNPSWDSAVSMPVEGPGTFAVDFGGRATCESSSGLASGFRLFPTLDGVPLATYGALLATQAEASASVTEAVQPLIPAGAHVLGLRALGWTFDDTSPGCNIFSVWIRAILTQE